VQRVQEVPRLLADADVHPLQAVQRLQVKPVVADRQVAPLAHGVAEVAREVGVAEVGGTLGSRAEDHDPAVLAPAQGPEARLQVEVVAGQPLGVAVAEQLGEAVAQGHPAGQHVAVADRRVGLVAEHHPAPVGGAGEVAGVGVEEAAPAAAPVHARAHERRAAEEQGGREAAVAQQELPAVDVGQHGVDQPGALPDAGRDPLPLPVRQEHGHEVQPPGVAAVVGVGVHVEGDAALAQRPPGAVRRGPPPLRAEPGEALHESAPVRPDRAVGGQHLVVRRRGPGVAGQQPVELGRCGGGRGGRHPTTGMPQAPAQVHGLTGRPPSSAFDTHRPGAYRRPQQDDHALRRAVDGTAMPWVPRQAGDVARTTGQVACRQVTADDLVRLGARVIEAKGVLA
jgi:hypothetical protein